MFKDIQTLIKIFIFLFIGFLFGCSEDVTSPPAIEDINKYENLNYSDKIEINAFPFIGNTETLFKINLSIKDSSLNIKKVRYDFSNDNNYDTTLSTSDTATSKFLDLRYNTIIASVFLENDSVFSCSTKVWVYEPQHILSGGGSFYEPNIYNGKMISVTHGGWHQAIFFDINTYRLDAFFDGYPNLFREMHCTNPSFDGKKLLFDNGVEYNFCYYDLEKDDTTVTDIPLNTSNYPVGEITWSLDNKKIYSMVYSNFPSMEVKSFNIETNEIKDVYEKGNYLCVVPGNNDLLAILEEVNENQGRLIILNTVSGAIVNTYEDIPFIAPFRILKDTDKIYFDGKLALYSLSKKKIYKMQFEGFDLNDHMEGEADINMEGDKFVFGTWRQSQGFYYVKLPGCETL